MAAQGGLHFGLPPSAIIRDKTILSIWATSVSAWGVMFAWSNSSYASYLGHGELGTITSVLELIPLASLFLLGWTVMVLAMMLPTSFPLINEFRRRTAGKHEDLHLSALLAGAVAVWIPFGVAIYAMDLGIHKAAESPPLLGNTWVLGASSLTLAGIYQLTRWKSEFLNDCCYPTDFVQSRWQPNLSGGVTFRLGFEYGKKSMGSHWAIMLLMFALGLGSMALMLLVGLVMAIEHVSRIGPRIRLPIGVVIIALAIYFGITGAGALST